MNYLRPSKFIAWTLIATNFILISSSQAQWQLSPAERERRIAYLDSRLEAERSLLQRTQQEAEVIRDAIYRNGAALMVGRTAASIALGSLAALILRAHFPYGPVSSARSLPPELASNPWANMTYLAIGGIPSAIGLGSASYYSARAMVRQADHRAIEVPIPMLDFWIHRVTNPDGWSFLYTSQNLGIRYTVNHPNLINLRNEIEASALTKRNEINPHGESRNILREIASATGEVFTGSTYRQLREVELPRARSMELLIMANIRYMEVLRGHLQDQRTQNR